MTTPAAGARVYLDYRRTGGEVSPLLFGGFAEHLGRCIYGGLYDPGSPQADARGFRRDVLAALRELGFTIVRYPGGNFLSGYDWRDGVGPREARPRRRELAWQSLETNQFGTNEFIEWCRELNALPMLGVNLGTGTISDAADLVEYCNAPVGTRYADLRVGHGYHQPHGVKYWCLGNEMDGPWQIGHLEADAYGRKAREAAKVMKWQDPSIQLILAGSSGSGMGTYPEWDRVVLEHCWSHVDYLSLHYYAANRENDTASFLALPVQFEEHLDTLAATLRYVKAKLRSKHDVFLSWDEWNVWYRAQGGKGGWKEAPPLLEEVYNLEDALVVAQWLSVFLRRCDVLKIACLAQVANVIGPILTTREGLLKQSIYYPLQLFRRYAAGRALDALVHAPVSATKRFGERPVLDVSATYDAATGKGAVFLVNRRLDAALPVEVQWQGPGPARVTALHVLAGNDPKAVNTFERPKTVVPKTHRGGPVTKGKFRLVLPPLSLTVLVTAGGS